mgnify:CR=1 FL=1
MRYTLDTNILINMELRYPREFFASLWDLMKAAVEQGEICMCEVAQKELERGVDSLASWVMSIPDFVCKITDDELATVAEIATTHPEWVQGQKNYGDPIAHAKADDLIIMTEEGRKSPGIADKNQKIPNIADEHGVTCIKFFDLLRAQGWRF